MNLSDVSFLVKALKIIHLIQMAKKVMVSFVDGDWKVKVVGNERASAVVDTKDEAVKIGIETAKREEAELFVKNKDGTIGFKNSYGPDPIDIKG